MGGGGSRSGGARGGGTGGPSGGEPVGGASGDPGAPAPRRMIETPAAARHGARTGRIEDDPTADAQQRRSGGPDARYLTVGEPPRDTPWRAAPDRTWPGRGSLTLTAIALVVALYFAGAAFFAVDHAWRFANPAAFPVAAAALAFLALATQIRASSGIALVLVFSFLAQLNWASLAEPQPIDDLARLWDVSQRFAASLAAGEIDWRILEAAPSPAALIVYALASLVFGDDLSVLRAAAAGLWTAQTWLIWRIAREIAEIRERATIVALLFGLAPTTIVFGALPSVEAVFGVFALASVYMLLSHRQRGLLISAALAGGLAALAFLTRPIGAAALVGLASALLLGAASSRGWRARGPIFAAAGCLGLGFAIGVAPQAALNLARGGTLSIAPGPAIGYQLLIGSNQDAGGRYSDAASTADLRRAGLRGAETPPIWEANARAAAIAWDRISADPAGFAAFAATEKMRRLWASEREMLTLSLSAVGPGAPSTLAPFGAGAAPPDALGVSGVAVTLLDGAYLAFIIAAALAAARLAASRGRLAKDPTRWVMVYGAIAAMAATALLFEARPRQHLALTPLLALTTPLAFAGRRRARRIIAPTLFAARRAAEGPAAAMLDPRKPIGDQPAEARLAHVLARMSKPPRERDQAGGRESDDGAPAADGGAPSDDPADDLLAPLSRDAAAARRRIRDEPADPSDRAPSRDPRGRRRAG